MEDIKEKVNAGCEEAVESAKQGAVNFLDDAAALKHTVDDLKDEKEAEKAAKKAEKRAKFEEALAAVKDSFAQGVAAFKSDMSITKESVDDAAEDQLNLKAAKKAARKENFDSALDALKESLEQCGDTVKADGEVLLQSLKGIAEDAGIDIKENSAIAEAYNAVKESFEQGAQAFTSDMNITKDIVEGIVEEKQTEKFEKELAKQEKFEETVNAVKESFEQGAEAFAADAAVTKESAEAAYNESLAQKEAKKEAKREKFDDNIEKMKDALK